MKTKLLILFFTLLSLPQASWSQRVDNGTEGLALVDAGRLAKPTEVETLLAAFEKGSMPSESFLKGSQNRSAIYYSPDDLSSDLRQFRKYQIKTSNFESNLLTRGSLLPTTIEISIRIPNHGYVTYEYLFSEQYNSLVSNYYGTHYDSSSNIRLPREFIREYMGSLIGLEVRYYDNNEFKKYNVPTNRIYNQFSTETLTAVIEQIYYIF